jgi:uncharacterized membrane protein
MRRCIAFAFLFTVRLALYGSISAQQIRSRAPITVVVTDPTGAAIPHAEVKIVSAPSLSLPAQKLETNGAGTLAVELEPGEYDITVHALSFRTASKHIIAQNGVAQSVEVLLQVGGCPPGCVVVPLSAAEQLFAVKGVVVDPSGAVIPQAEVVFKGESDRIAAHTGMDGAVNVNLEAGKYVVTISAFGFATTKLVDVFVPGPTADVFRVSLKVDQSQINYGSDLGHSGIAHVPTVPSEMPDVIIKDEPTPTSLPVVQPATKRRSMRCLYLWRCSAPQP